LAPLLYFDYETDRQLTLNDLTLKQWELLYECWKHNCRQFEKWVWKATGGWNPITRMIMSLMLTRIGTNRILAILKAMDRKMQREGTL